MSVQTKLTDKTIRRKANEKRFKRLRNKQAAVSGKQPLRSEEYKAWIRTLPCLLCREMELPLQWSETEAAHSGPHGVSQKSSDYSCLPLCAFHHRIATDSYHALGPKFFAHHRLKEREVLVAGYNLAFKERE